MRRWRLFSHRFVF